MTLKRIQTGKSGEVAAAQYLKKSNFYIIEQNYQTNYGEIDIIAKDNDTLVFVEVKTRKLNKDFGPPQIAVNLKKQKQIIKTSLRYLKQKKLTTVRVRFDVVAVTISEKGAIPTDGIQLIKNAYQVR